MKDDLTHRDLSREEYDIKKARLNDLGSRKSAALFRPLECPKLTEEELAEFKNLLHLFRLET